MTEDNTDPVAALRAWLATSPDASDLRRGARLTMMHRILTNVGPHGIPEQWSEYLRAPRTQERHLFYDGPTSPEADAERLRDMTPDQLLDEANKRGGKK